MRLEKDVREMFTEGYKVVPGIDKKRYPNREKEGLEGPYRARKNGKIYYYDTKAGKYYDPGSDVYLEPRDIGESVDTSDIVTDIVSVLSNQYMREASSYRDARSKALAKMNKAAPGSFEKKEPHKAWEIKLTDGSVEHITARTRDEAVKGLSGVKEVKQLG